ncbi:MAG: hypothetical protein ACJAVK_000664 [Akkermansiaceae bacterium]|jgi:hypothetical protein
MARISAATGSRMEFFGNVVNRRLFHNAIINALKDLPMIFKDIKDEKEKAKETADYKKMSGQGYVKLCELEMAYLDGDEDKAAEIKDLSNEMPGIIVNETG